MAVAVGVSAHAEHQRQQAIERITDLLEHLHDDKLEQERSELGACRDAIDKATSVLLDRGRVGLSLGLDSSSYAISVVVHATERRLSKWPDALAALPDRQPVELDQLTKSFPGINEEGGTFRTHLEIARLAIALKRRVLVLQAVEHAQQDTENPFKSFIGALRDDEHRINELESDINAVLSRLSNIELKRGGGFLNLMLTQGEA